MFQRRNRPMSSRPTNNARAGRWAMVLIGLMFVVMGSIFTVIFLVLPARGMIKAQSWIATPCVIESSRVLSHRSDDGTTYSIEITYRYTFDEQSYTSDRYHFISGSSSGRAGKQAVVDAHPPGTQATCYVNPEDPTQAVIHRGWSNELLFGIIPIGFTIGGIVMLVVAVRMRSTSSISSLDRSAGRTSAASASLSADAATAARPVILHSQGGRRTKTIFLGFMAVMWNGLTWTMLVMTWRDGAWLPFAFLLLFVAAGLLLLGVFVHSLLAMFNPRVTLELDRPAVRLGEPLTIAWRLDGNVARLSDFRLRLEGREEATYRRGTRTTTDRHTFARIEIEHLTDRTAILTAAGRTHVALPVTTVPSWVGGSNKIVWELVAEGEIVRWPDIKDTFPLTVLPARVSPAAATASATELAR